MITLLYFRGYLKIVIEEAGLCVWRAAVNTAALVRPGYAPVLALRIGPCAASVALLEGLMAGDRAAAAQQLGGRTHHEAHDGRQPPSPAFVYTQGTKDCIANSGAAVEAGEKDVEDESSVVNLTYRMQV